MSDQPLWIGLFQGGSQYPGSKWATDAEGFDSIEHATATLQRRYDNTRIRSAPRVVQWLDAVPRLTTRTLRWLHPGVDKEATILLVPWGTTLQEIDSGEVKPKKIYINRFEKAMLRKDRS